MPKLIFWRETKRPRRRNKLQAGVDPRFEMEPQPVAWPTRQPLGLRREAKRHAALDSADVSHMRSAFPQSSGGDPKRRRRFALPAQSKTWRLGFGSWRAPTLFSAHWDHEPIRFGPRAVPARSGHARGRVSVIFPRFRRGPHAATGDRSRSATSPQPTHGQRFMGSPPFVFSHALGP